MKLKNDSTLYTAAFLFAIVLSISGCPAGGETGFKSTDQELMKELRAALKDANIQFREDEDGIIRYSWEDSATADKIREKLDKELHSGVSVKYDDQEAMQYLRELLTSMKMKYRIEIRADGEWTRWYPQNEDQRKEIPMKVVEHIFELKKKQLSATCVQGTSLSSVPPNITSLDKTRGSC